jgi:hypothetical protein
VQEERRVAARGQQDRRQGDQAGARHSPGTSLILDPPRE